MRWSCSVACVFSKCVREFLQLFRRAVFVAVRDRFPAPVVHVVWWHHFEQGVEPFSRVVRVLFVVGTQVAALSVGLFFSFASGDACRDVCSPNLSDVAPMPSARLLPQRGSCLVSAFVPL